ncbi:hypothetical protein [Herbiconiux ginsengi]|uniref:Glycosyl hydrolase family 65, N-terminal domain n=1 Tax=Herbiconiux ginsengi TaxID=381665 RepID=A0A1H3TI37_9MICO|nr:hypothetical protein [Herbiconiux ginsengi]SDZ49461.1 hypothetical protein SAMN05216554_4220 [Herbiconiux ginsengi]
MGRDKINRERLVARHNIVLDEVSAEHVLTVGNGDFAYSFDFTGMQTFPRLHDQSAAWNSAQAAAGGNIGAAFAAPPTIDTATMSNWGWHEMPNPNGYVLDDAMTDYQTARGTVSYPDRYAFTPEGKIAEGYEAGAWLHANPHRLDLGRIGLVLRDAVGAEPVEDPQRVTAVTQSLDLWSGAAQSEITFAGVPVTVETVASPDADKVAFRITSPLLADGRLAIGFRFPYGSDGFLQTGDWDADDKHTSTLQTPGEGQATIGREIDSTGYTVDVRFDSGDIREVAPHRFELTTGASSLEVIVTFSPGRLSTLDQESFEEIKKLAKSGWRDFWESGAAIELCASDDERALELERRVVLSQYLTRVNSSGVLPPQETGLITNSWHGKFHLEMHFWHAAHFAGWGRPELLERSLAWYVSILDVARQTARRQGYPGARWPKQVGPDGRESPSEIGSLLIWQQPHILYMLELAWGAATTAHRAQLLNHFAELVEDTATFMGAFVEERDGSFHLGPPVMPAQEFYDARTTEDPTFELSYWWWGLEIAQRWRERNGDARRDDWTNVQNRMARPLVQDGTYQAIATPPYLRRDDHPSLLAALGVIPPTPLIDPEIMSATLEDVLQNWDWNSAFGWDYPVMAMTAGRLHNADLAADLLTREAIKNRFTAVGHSPQLGSLLPIYLPSNGALLAAISLLATAGPDFDPLFPTTWNVNAEGFVPWPDSNR